MANEHHGQTELLLKVGQQIEDLCANRNVQSRSGLVGDDGVGVQRQGAGNCHALALTARKLAGKDLGGRAGKAGELQELLDALLLLGLGAQVVDAHGVEQLLANDHAGVERSCGVLEHDRDDTTHMAAILGGALGDVLALKVDLAARGGLQAAHDVGGGGLTATGLADDADRLTGHELNRHTLDSVNQIGVQNRTGTGPKGDVDVIKEDDRLDAVDCGLAHLHHLRVRGQTICLEHLIGELGIEVLGAGHALEDRTGVQTDARMARAGREAIALGEIARAGNGAGNLMQTARTALDGQDGAQKTAGVLVDRVGE